MRHVLQNAPYHGRETADETVGLHGDRLQDRLHVAGRGGDDLQDFGRRCLLLASLIQLLAKRRNRRTLRSNHGWRGWALGFGAVTALYGLFPARRRRFCLAARS